MRAAISPFEAPVLLDAAAAIWRRSRLVLAYLCHFIGAAGSGGGHQQQRERRENNNVSPHGYRRGTIRDGGCGPTMRVSQTTRHRHNCLHHLSVNSRVRETGRGGTVRQEGWATTGLSHTPSPAHIFMRV